MSYSSPKNAAVVAQPPQTDLPILPRLEGCRNREIRAIRKLGDSVLFPVDLLPFRISGILVERQDALHAANEEGSDRLSVARLSTRREYHGCSLRLTTLHLHRP